MAQTHTQTDGHGDLLTNSAQWGGAGEKKQQVVKIGDEVVVLNKQNKHTVISRYMVTGKEQDRVQVQKIPHP